MRSLGGGAFGLLRDVSAFGLDVCLGLVCLFFYAGKGMYKSIGREMEAARTAEGLKGRNDVGSLTIKGRDGRGCIVPIA